MKKIIWTIVLVASVFCFLSVWLTKDTTVITVKLIGSLYMAAWALEELIFGEVKR